MRYNISWFDICMNRPIYLTSGLGNRFRFFAFLREKECISIVDIAKISNELYPIFNEKS